MKSDLEVFLNELRTFIDQHDYGAADALCNAQALIQYEHPYTVIYACIIHQHFKRSAEKLIELAVIGLELEPDNQVLLEFQFDGLLELAEYAKAIEIGRHLCSEEPYHYQLHYNMADALEQTNAQQESNTYRAQGHFGAGLVFSNHDDDQKAVNEFHECLVLNPLHSRAKIQLVKSLLSVGDGYSAQSYLESFSEHHDVAIDMLLLRLRLAQYDEDQASATELVQKILVLDPNCNRALRAKYQLAMQSGDINGSFDALENLLEKDPSDIWGRFTSFNFAERLTSDASFINDSYSSPYYWRALTVLLEAGLEDYVVQRLIKTFPHEGGDLIALVRFLRKFEALGMEKTLFPLFESLPLDRWGNIDLFCMAARGLAYKGYGKCYDYLETKLTEFDQHPQLGWHLAKARIEQHLWYDAGLMEASEVERYLPWVKWQLQQDPEDAFANLCLGLLAIHYAQFKESEHFIRRARTSGLWLGMMAMSAYWLAFSLYCLERYEEALEIYVTYFEQRCHDSWDVENKQELKALIKAELA